MNKRAKDIFGINKPVIGMLHLDYLAGSSRYKGMDFVVDRAKNDIKSLISGGIDGILIENWKEDSVGQFVNPETAKSMVEVTREISEEISIPFGINVLNNDYRLAYQLASQFGASFVQLDVLVDEVESDFSHSDSGMKNPFRIIVDHEDVKNTAVNYGMEKLPLYCFVKPKHYKMLDDKKSIEDSVKDAESFGVSGVLVTKATGVSPTVELLTKAKSASRQIDVGIGSGLSVDNVEEFLKTADFAVVGSSIKIDGDVDNIVDIKRVRALMGIVRQTRGSI